MSYCRWLMVPLVLIIGTPAALGFCGFYVGRADTDLFNDASKIVIARHQGRTVITMVSDYHGELSDFALVVPVPTVLARRQIHVTNNALVDHLDAYTAPRLVEYYDDDPCVLHLRRLQVGSLAADAQRTAPQDAAARAAGVVIEAQYTVGEYDILILSAQQSDGLQRWLVDNGYHMPQSANPVLERYIQQGMKFFVARVNLQQQVPRGGYLRPLQIAFESEHFMLPIRLGMVNARGAQEMFVFILSKNGRVETTNYRTVKIPSEAALPLFVSAEFEAFYQAMFDTAVRREKHNAVFMEYAWDMSWCDPCAADPLSSAQLRELGVHWIEAPLDQRRGQPPRGVQPPPQDVFVTRLHVRYSSEHFPHDLQFRETHDRSNFQGRYILRHPFRGDPNACKTAPRYYAGLPQRFASEARNLAQLSGWDINTIRAKMEKNGQSATLPPPLTWWERLWSE